MRELPLRSGTTFVPGFTRGASRRQSGRADYGAQEGISNDYRCHPQRHDNARGAGRHTSWTTRMRCREGHLKNSAARLRTAHMTVRSFLDQDCFPRRLGLRRHVVNTRLWNAGIRIPDRTSSLPTTTAHCRTPWLLVIDTFRTRSCSGAIPVSAGRWDCAAVGLRSQQDGPDNNEYRRVGSRTQGRVRARQAAGAVGRDLGLVGDGLRDRIATVPSPKDASSRVSEKLWLRAGASGFCRHRP